MNETNVPLATEEATVKVLRQLSEGLADLTPETRKAATYILENPNDVGVSSIREIAEAAQVKPNSFVRMARSFGFDGYEKFRELFREEIRQGGPNFPDRARWLQSLSSGEELDKLYAGMVTSSIANIENTFTAIDAASIKAAADAIVAARHTYVLGVGINHSLARNFAYLADMAIDNVIAIPREGNLAIDDLAFSGPDDVLLAMTFKPYRTEVLEAVEIARQQKSVVIGISDSPASPIIADSEHSFVVHTDTLQFFPSIGAAAALLETLMAFVIADASPDVIANIQRFHERRKALGIYKGDV